MSLLLILSIISGYLMSLLLYQRQLSHAQLIRNKIIQKNNHIANKKFQASTLKIQTVLKEYDRLKILITKKYQQNIQSLQEQIAYLNSEIELLEKSLTKKEKLLQNQVISLTGFNAELVTTKKLLQDLENKHKQHLLKISKINIEVAQHKILSDLTQKLTQEKEILLNKVTNYLALYAENMGRRIVSIIVQRCSFSHWYDSYPNIVSFSNRNYVKTLLKETFLPELLAKNLEISVELHEDENIIFIQESDGYSREIARRILEKLVCEEVLDKKKISDCYHKICLSLKEETIKDVQAACAALKIFHFPHELAIYMARLKYRTSFSQNILAHSREVAILAYMIAGELQWDSNIAKLSGFLHDIGKSLDHKESGGHSALGQELLEKASIDAKVIEGVVEHHEDISPEKPYAALVNIADAISAARPGARRETIEKYFKKLEKLESIARNIDGVLDAYAVSAGKEVRVIVDPDKVTDEKARKIAKEMAQTIEKELLYSGIVKIIVIREKTFEAYS